VNTAALFRDFNIDSGQGKLEAVPDDGYSDETEQGIAGIRRVFLQDGYEVFRHDDWERAHEEEKEQGKRRGPKGTGSIKEDERSDPRQNDHGSNRR